MSHFHTLGSAKRNIPVPLVFFDTVIFGFHKIFFIFEEASLEFAISLSTLGTRAKKINKIKLKKKEKEREKEGRKKNFKHVSTSLFFPFSFFLFNFIYYFGSGTQGISLSHLPSDVIKLPK